MTNQNEQIEKSIYQERDPEKFKTLITNLLLDLRTFDSNDILDKGFLLFSEKEKIKTLLNAINVTISGFEKSKRSDSEVANEMEDFIQKIRSGVTKFADKFGIMEVRDETGTEVENDIQKEDLDVVEGSVRVVSEEPEPTSPEDNGEIRFQQWKDNFITERRFIEVMVAGEDFTIESLKSIKDAFIRLDRSLSEAMDQYYDKVFTNFLSGLDRLKKKIETYETEASKAYWDKLRQDHPPEFLALFDAFTAYKNSLDDPEWDPRVEYPVGGVTDNLIDTVEHRLDKALKIRELLNTEKTSDPLALKRRDDNIQRIYFKPAEDFLEKMKERVREQDIAVFENWKQDLLDSPKLKELVEELEKDLPDDVSGTTYSLGESPEEILEALKTLRIEVIEEERTTTSSSAKGLEVLQKEYFSEVDSRAEVRIIALQSLANKGKEQIEHAEFENNQFIVILLERIGFVDSIEDRHGFYNTPHPDIGLNRNYKRSDLKEIRKTINDAYTQVDRTGLLSKKDVTKLVAEKIDEINEGRSRVIDRIEKMLRPEVSEMTLKEIAEELLDARMDPFLWKEWKVASGADRERDIVNEFIRQGLTAIDIDSELKDIPAGELREAKRSELAKKEIDRITTKVGVQLGTLDNVLQHENEKASGNRGNLFAEAHTRVVTRRELLIATTEHPEHGHQVKEIFDRVIKVSSLRKGECVVIRNGKEVSILENDIKDEDGNFTEEIVYKHDSLLNFNALQGEKGRTILNRYIEREFKDFSPEAKNLSQRAFIAFDFLTLSLRELQKRTQTRGFNGGIADKDRVMFSDPVAAAVHRMFRYGGNKEDWSMWTLLYHEDVENSPFKYGNKEPLKPEAIARGITAETAKTSDWSWPNHHHMAELQKMMRLHEATYFNIDDITHGTTNGFGNSTGEGIPFAGFCESIGPSTDGIFRLQSNRRKGEKLFLFDRVVDHLGNVTLVNDLSSDDLSDDSFVGAGEEDNQAAWFGFLEDPTSETEDDVDMVIQGEVITADEFERFSNLADDEDEAWTGLRPSEEFIERRRERLVASANEGNEDINGLDLYSLAEEGGFAQLLEMAFKDIPVDLTYNEIMKTSKDGGQGGYLGVWLQAAGRAKMFPGEHLEKYLFPMLLHYCLRLAQSFDEYTEPREIQRLYSAITDALRSSRDGGGLADYQPELTRIINALSEKPIEKIVVGTNGKKRVERITNAVGSPVKEQASLDLGPPDDVRRDQRLKYVNEWYKSEYGEDPPFHIMGWSPAKIARELLLPELERWNTYLEMTQGYHHLEYPCTRSGNLKAKVDDQK